LQVAVDEQTGKRDWEPAALDARNSGYVHAAKTVAGRRNRWRDLSQRPERIFGPSIEDLEVAGPWSAFLRDRIRLDGVVENSHRSAYAGSAIAKHVPCKTETRSEVILVGAGDASRNSRIAGEQDSRWCVGKSRGSHVCPNRLETRQAIVLIHPGKEGLPAK